MEFSELVTLRNRIRDRVVRLFGEKVLESVGTVLHLGSVPVMPGFFGSLAGLALFWLIGAHTVLFSVLAAILFVLGTVSAEYMEEKTGTADPSCVVIDEMVGIMAALLLVERSVPAAVAALFAFRFFDIVKPFPGRQVESIRGGVGIMLDDLVAGVYTVLVVRIAGVLMSG